jgi:transposase
MQVSTIGVDLAKNVFQVHGVDSAGKVVISRQLRRKQVIDFFSKIPPCLVGMEACGTAHHWAREVSKLGHTVRLMPPSYVKGYVKRSKNDAADAAAICEAVTDQAAGHFLGAKDLRSTAAYRRGSGPLRRASQPFAHGRERDILFKESPSSRLRRSHKRLGKLLGACGRRSKAASARQLSDRG